MVSSIARQILMLHTSLALKILYHLHWTRKLTISLSQVTSILICSVAIHPVKYPNSVNNLLSITRLEPTHFTENSSSLIDIILTSDKNNLIYSGVAEPFLQQDVRYHCPIYGVFKYTKTSKKSFTRRIWSYDRGDYYLLRTKVANTDWDSLSDPDVKTHASNITNHLNSLTAECIPNKTVRIRPSDPPWITTAIRKLIRNAKENTIRPSKIDTPRFWNTFRKRRNKVIESIRLSKQQYLDHLSNQNLYLLRIGGLLLKLL